MSFDYGLLMWIEIFVLVYSLILFIKKNEKGVNLINFDKKLIFCLKEKRKNLDVFEIIDL